MFLAIAYNQKASSINSLQEPQHTRQFDKDFKNRYSGRKYNYEGKNIVTKTPQGSGNYEDYKEGKPNLKEQNNSENTTINLGAFDWIFYIVLVLAVVYLAYILLNEGSSGLFSSKRNTKLNSYDDITAENIENIDINHLIKEAEQNKDYRLAIRYYYLLVLKTLSIKKYIKFEDDKTNAEYLNELSSKSFSEKFSYVSYLYNHIWYGEFPLNTEKYTKAKTNFSTLLTLVK